MSGLSPSDIRALAEIFDASDWSSLHLRVGEDELFLGRDAGAAGLDHAGSGATQPTPAAAGATAPATATKPAAGGTPAAPAAAAAAELPPGTVAVRAPNLGTFYRAPKPGAAPYVEVGQTVEADTEICLIEVMKLFTPVVAGVRGVIRQVLVEDTQMVEHDQVLFHIETED